MDGNGSARTMQIQACHACGGVHDELSLKQYSRPQHPWTHFYICPTLGDPVPMAIKLIGETPMELNRKLVNDVARLTEAGQYLALNFCVVNGVCHGHYNRSAFPIEHLEWVLKQCLAQIEDAKQSAGALPAPTGPLRRAKFNPGARDPMRDMIEQIKQTPGAMVAGPLEQALLQDRPAAVAEAAHGDTDGLDVDDLDDDCDDESVARSR